MSQNIFLEALKVQPTGPDTYIGIVDNNQRFGQFAHGGFVASLAVHSALEYVKTTLQRTNAQHCTHFHAQFLKPVDKSELHVRIEQLSIGKALVKLRVVFTQKETIKVTVDVNIVDASTNRGVFADTGFRLNPAPAPVDFAELEKKGRDSKWIKYHLPYAKSSQGQPLAHWDFCFTIDGPAHPRLHDMWVRLHDQDARTTTKMLPIIADGYLRMADNYIPDSDFSYDACVKRAKRAVNGDVRQDDLNAAITRTWSATQSMSLEIVRQLPEDGVKWLLMRAEGKSFKDGKLVAELTILDEYMNLIAIGQGVDLIIPAQKWVEEGRRTKSGAQIMKI